MILFGIVGRNQVINKSFDKFMAIKTKFQVIIQVIYKKET